MSNIAVLTSGGDSPGMNAAVMAVARNAAYYGMSLIGIKRGYNGLLGRGEKPGDDFVRLDLDTVLDIADLPGTYLRTARCREFLDPAMREKAAYGEKLPPVIMYTFPEQLKPVANLQTALARSSASLY